MVQVGMDSVPLSARTAGPQGTGAAWMPAANPGAGVDHPIVIAVRNLRKEYRTPSRAGRQAEEGRLVLFDGLDLDVAEGEMLAIVGQSGAGKSTLLHILAALDTPSSGDVFFSSIPVGKLSPERAASFRNREVGYVWQFHYLLPEFTALENVAMPLLARGTAKAEALASAEQWLGEVGLGDRVTHRTGELSGGEQQRVSLARALVTRPRALLADEPTGDLDTGTAEMVFGLIRRLHTTHQLTSVIVTHNMALAGQCDRILRLEKGRLTEVARGLA